MVQAQTDTIDRYISIDTTGLGIFVTRNYVDGQDINYNAAMIDTAAAIRSDMGTGAYDDNFSFFNGAVLEANEVVITTNGTTVNC